MPRVLTRNISIAIGENTFQGVLHIPRAARGVILLAGASGSDPKSPQSSYLAERLAVSGLAALLLDLRTTDETALPEADAPRSFDIALRADRLLTATDWLAGNPALAELAIGYFGANSGATVVLAAAARLPNISAVVSCSGRPDLVGEALSEIRAPTLLIVAARDSETLAFAESALMQMNCEAELKSVPDATSRFPEPGTWEQAVSVAVEWFEGHLSSAPKRPQPSA